MALTVTTLRGPPARTDLHVAEAAYSMAELYREPSGLPRAESEPLGRPDGEARTGHSWTTRSADSRAPALGSGQPGPSLQAPRKPWFGVDSEQRQRWGCCTQQDPQTACWTSHCSSRSLFSRCSYKNQLNKLWAKGLDAGHALLPRAGGGDGSGLHLAHRPL